MTVRKIGATALVIVAVATMSACTADDDGDPSQSPSSSSGPVLPSGDSSSLTPPPEGAINEDTGEVVTTAPVPMWDDASRESAVTAAETVLSAFAQPDLSFDQWWAQVQPLLDQKASQDYSYMDPAVIPVTEITGEGTLLDEDSAYVARVEVPTNAGSYTVIMSRVDGNAPWLTSRIIPPEGSS
jgi:hypothetical protein